MSRYMDLFHVDEPPFRRYYGQESYFDGDAPLSVTIGYLVVLGFALLFSIVTAILVYLNRHFGIHGYLTSEYFNTAGRLIKTGLTANVVVSQWTWAATILQSSYVVWAYGISGAFWYASGATIQILLFGVLSVSVKKLCPSAHTVAEIVNARWGRRAHITFLIFCFAANIIVTSMLMLGGAATVEALTGVDHRLASFFIPLGVVSYTSFGGLQATFLASYIHTVVIFAVLVIMIFVVYIKEYSSDTIYEYLHETVSYTEEDCKQIFSNEYGVTFYEKEKYACGQVLGNLEGSYLTMFSVDGFLFGLINVVGNFGIVFVDQSYWQSAIAARPTCAAKGYLLGGLCWFAIPFSLGTSLGLVSVALMLPITADEAAKGLVPPAVATHLLGKVGSTLILIMVFMAIMSTGSAESIAFSSLVAYDVYREYVNPGANGNQILIVSRVAIVLFGIFMSLFSLLLLYIDDLNLGWVYLFMGIIMGSAFFPLWNMMTWKKASGTGAVIAAWAGLFLAITGWICAAKLRSGEVTVKSLGTNEVMLIGNMIAIVSSGLIHWLYSKFIDPQDYDFSILESRIALVEDDLRGLTAEDRDPVLLDGASKWIRCRVYILSFILIILWPVLSIPARIFTQGYFAFWVFISVIWGFSAALVMTILPVVESQEEILAVISNMHKRISVSIERLQ